MAKEKLADPRLGHYDKEKDTIIWPELTLVGKPFKKPATLMTQLGNGYFVARDPFMPRAEQQVIIDELLAKISPVTASESPAKKAKEVVVDGSN